MIRSWVACLCALLLLNSFYVVGSDVNEETISMPVGDEVNYVPHAPIRIDSDADFPGIASAGDGSELSPWIIEGWDIDGTGFGYCIYIGNTSEYFEVRDCYLHEASGFPSVEYFRDSGIHLFNSNNASLVNNNVILNRDGVYCYNSQLIGIFSHCANDSYNGIFLIDSQVDTIDGNIIHNNTFGMYSYLSSNTTVTNNNIANNEAAGMIIEKSNYWTIKYNLFYNNNLGLNLGGLLGTDYCTVYNNNFIDNNNQAYDDGTNFWDNGYPDGGNYYNNFNTSLYVGNESFFASGGEEGFYLDQNENTPGFQGIQTLHEIRYVWDNDWSFVYVLVEGVDFDINITTGWVQVYWGGFVLGDQLYSEYTCLASPPDLFWGPNQDIPDSDFIYDMPYPILGGTNEDSYPLAYPIIDGRFQRGPIRIDSNADFDQAHGVINWNTGDGSPGNPWIIEKWDINGAGYGYCIYVGNTTEYFIIRNCYLHNADGVISFPFYSDSGIHLFNVQNAKIENNILNQNTNVGIYLLSAYYNIIADNDISGSAAGMSLMYTGLNYITNNTIVQCGEGIKVNYANNDSLSNNTITGNFRQNMTLFQGEQVWQECASDLTEQNNAITWEEYLYTHRLASYQKIVNLTNCSAYLVHIISDIMDDLDLSIFYDSNFNGIIDPYESIKDGEMGVIDYGDWSMGGYAICADADGDEAIKLINPPDGQYIIAVFGWGVTTGSVEGEGPPAQFELYISEDENSYDTISHGIYAENSEVTIHGNNVTNFDLGIYCYDLDSSVISNNSLSNNCAGINLLYSWNSQISGNQVSSCDYGIYLSDSNDNVVYHNSLIGNTQQGFNTGNNQWDNGYPSGGNYWSDYSGVDLNNGPGQDVPPSDGIGDTPYADIAGGSGVNDNYPLMEHGNSIPSQTYNISLDIGWNLISLPLFQFDKDIYSVLSSINGDWDRIKVYDSQSMDPWLSSSIYSPNLNEIDLMDYTAGIWIHMVNAVNLTVEGALPVSSDITLYAGWNLVGYPTLNDSIDVGTALWGTGADQVEVCDLAEPGLIKEVGPTYVMQPGEGYWIHVPADTVWTVDW